MIVMKYAENGSLRKNLQNIVKDKWVIKLRKLQDIISGLNTIHQQKLIHCDFHHGNILIQPYSLPISDLGLCKPIEYYQSTSKKNDIYGILPFIAPEVLRGNPYTLASDIYSFSMIMWEFISGILPFDDKAHDFHLALNICKGECPEIVKNIPQCYIDLMKKCWDKDSLKRPSAFEIKNIIQDWISNITKKYDTEEYNTEEYNTEEYNTKEYNTEKDNIEKYKKYKNIAIEFYKADKVLEQKQKQTNTSDIINNKSHSEAYHISRLLDFTKKLNEMLDQEDMKFVVMKIIKIISYMKQKLVKVLVIIRIFVKYKKFLRYFLIIYNLLFNMLNRDFKSYRR